ncbi:amidohydrolase family protein [Mucilaginibacter flavus]|uniref:amidohydrolase family protein n=1 Tax=Mucilaginibacter flavus TaxID=931504 RepID=UPI0025B4F743|nr:amidohydrolase family protein [Mucilaginibacter flavus]MDN3583229.1 amidohydrolase family protein [Mucilaginibacter flavus]
MVLQNVRLADSGQLVNVRLTGAKIAAISPAQLETDDNLQLYFDDCIIFPGLINSHEHLDFNLFPQLGNRIYNNYTEWGAYIHKEFKAEIAAILQVPQHLRVLWGIYKNLVCGVTTVVNHGEVLRVDNALINIIENTHDLHSAAFEKRWKLKLNNPLKRKLPVVIHTGEGTDEIAFKEIDSLIKWNKLGRDLIGIHAVAMTPAQAPFFKAIVWCPQSNYYLLNKTAAIQKLKPFSNILFGTDSTLTGSWNIWDHISMARNTGMLNNIELYEALNKTAARVWHTNNGEIAAGKAADLVIVKPASKPVDPNAFYATQPADIQLIIHNGNIRLFDQQLLPKLVAKLKGKQFSLIHLGESYKYVEGNLGALTNDIQSYLPDAAFPFTFIQQQIF